MEKGATPRPRPYLISPVANRTSVLNPVPATVRLVASTGSQLAIERTTILGRTARGLVAAATGHVAKGVKLAIGIIAIGNTVAVVVKTVVANLGGRRAAAATTAALRVSRIN